MCMDHLQNAVVVTKRRKLKKLSLLQTTFGTWATLTKGTEWLIVIQLVREHGSG